MSGITQHLNVVLCPDAENAIETGYNYNQWNPRPLGLTIEKAVIVQNGTVGGNSTVDLILVDETGKQYVAMVTGNLLKALPL